MSAEEFLGGVPSKSLKIPFSVFLVTLRTFSWAGTGVLSTGDCLHNSLATSPSNFLPLASKQPYFEHLLIARKQIHIYDFWNFSAFIIYIKQLTFYSV